VVHASVHLECVLEEEALRYVALPLQVVAPADDLAEQVDAAGVVTARGHRLGLVVEEGGRDGSLTVLVRPPTKQFAQGGDGAGLFGACVRLYDGRCRGGESEWYGVCSG